MRSLIARRDVLRWTAYLPGLVVTLAARPVAGANTALLAEDDPLAEAFGYVDDVAEVDRARTPNFRAGSRCDNCVQYKGQPGAASGPCNIFPGKTVAANGWCRVWMK